MIDEDELAARIAEDAGTGDVVGARRALEMTLIGLATALDRIEIEALAAELPARLADAVRRATRSEMLWNDDPFVDLAAREGIPRGLAFEYACVACGLLSARLGPDVLQLLSRALPSPWRELVHRRVVELPPPVPRPSLLGKGHTLATGQPGSRQAVADHAARAAQPGSVAAADNPHGDEKLSSGAPSQRALGDLDR